jgi:hypothetical protein
VPARRFPPPLLITFRETTSSTHSWHRISAVCVGNRGFHMRGKSLTNETTHPYLVEIPVATVGLDVPLSRQIVRFHKSRRLQLRHARIISRYGKTYYRWCFPDLMTALAFVEQFGGAFYEPNLDQIAGRDEARRNAANVAMSSTL